MMTLPLFVFYAFGGTELYSRFLPLVNTVFNVNTWCQLSVNLIPA